MRKITFLCLIFISLSIFCVGNNPNYNQTKIQLINVGGVTIKIPFPDSDFVEVGNNNRKLLEVNVPDMNKLLGAYVLAEDLPFIIKDTDETKIMTKNALVEISRSLEFIDFHASDFRYIVEQFDKKFKKSTKLMLKHTEVEFNNRMDSLDLTKMQVKLGEPTQLGCFFSKQDLYGQAMIMAFDRNSITRTRGVLAVILRVKMRYIMIYIYADYKGNETLNWLRRFGEKWGDKILKANQPSIKQK